MSKNQQKQEIPADQKKPNIWDPKIKCIKITFPEPVDVPNEIFQQIDDAVSRICKLWERHNRGQIMWPAGIGHEIVSMPMTKEDDEEGVPIVFDESVFTINCASRINYDWRCKKCRYPQDMHSPYAIDPPAGGCEFEPNPYPPRG